MTRGAVDPSASAQRIDELASGYRESQILFTAHRLGIFTALAGGERELDDLASRLGLDRRGLRILCDALVALGLLEKERRGYRNAPPASAALLPSSPAPRRAIVTHGARLYERWARLDDAVTTGHPVPEAVVDPRLEEDAARFAAAMADVGRLSAGVTADILGLDGVRRLLDLGGGPGTYAVEFARRQPALEAVVFDRPETIAVAVERIAAAGLSGRVSARAGDAFEDDLGGPYDLILASNLIHIYTAVDNVRLIARAARALAPAGRLAVKDLLLDPDRTSPAGAALFAVNMLVNTDGGDCYTVDELASWCAAAGLEVERVADVGAHSRLLIARRPEAP